MPEDCDAVSAELYRFLVLTTCLVDSRKVAQMQAFDIFVTNFSGNLDGSFEEAFRIVVSLYRYTLPIFPSCALLCLSPIC